MNYKVFGALINIHGHIKRVREAPKSSFEENSSNRSTDKTFKYFQLISAFCVVLRAVFHNCPFILQFLSSAPLSLPVSLSLPISITYRAILEFSHTDVLEASEKRAAILSRGRKTGTKVRETYSIPPCYHESSRKKWHKTILTNDLYALHVHMNKQMQNAQIRKILFSIRIPIYEYDPFN